MLRSGKWKSLCAGYQSIGLCVVLSRPLTTLTREHRVCFCACLCKATLSCGEEKKKKPSQTFAHLFCCFTLTHSFLLSMWLLCEFLKCSSLNTEVKHINIIILLGKQQDWLHLWHRNVTESVHYDAHRKKKKIKDIWKTKDSNIVIIFRKVKEGNVKIKR